MTVLETMCAGTLAKYAAQGHKVFIATATNGNIGSAHHTMEEIGRIRKQEAANSAAIIGAEDTASRRLTMRCFSRSTGRPG